MSQKQRMMSRRTIYDVTPLQLGYIAHEANSGQEALNQLQERRYKAILMDVDMPVMNGLACTEKIRAIETGSNCRIPIIAFTSQTAKDIKQKCLDAGMDAFLDKGCSRDELAKVLKQFVPGLPDLPGVAA